MRLIIGSTLLDNAAVVTASYCLEIGTPFDFMSSMKDFLLHKKSVFKNLAKTFFILGNVLNLILLMNCSH